MVVFHATKVLITRSRKSCGQFYAIFTCWTIITFCLLNVFLDDFYHYWFGPAAIRHIAPLTSNVLNAAGAATPKLLSTPNSSGRRVLSDDYVTEFGSFAYFLLCAIGGAIACGLTHTAVVPLDLVKCRQQVEPLKYSDLTGAFRLTMKEEGLRGLSKGWGATLIGYSMQGFCKYGLYEVFKVAYAMLLGETAAYTWRTFVYLSASASAEFIADIFLAPMEATKVRTQTMPTFPEQLRHALQRIWKDEGIFGFYKGLSTLWLRQVPYTMMKFACFERTLEALYKYVVPKPMADCSKAEQLMVTFIAGYIAGVLCAAVSHPADAVVSKLNQDKEARPLDVLRKLGPEGIWRGLLARVLMIGTLTALQWFLYDSWKVSVGLPRSPPPEMPKPAAVMSAINRGLSRPLDTTLMS